jgi:hypothetical protein
MLCNIHFVAERILDRVMDYSSSKTLMSMPGNERGQSYDVLGKG